MLLCIMVLQGCDAQPDDTGQLVQISAVAGQGLDVTGSALHTAVSAQDAAGVRSGTTRSLFDDILDDILDEVGFEFSREIDRTIDLDMVNPATGEDLFSYASGQIHIHATAQGTVVIVAGPVIFDPVTITMVTDVTVSDPASGAGAIWPGNTQVIAAAELDWEVNDPDNWQYTIGADMTIDDREIQIFHPDYFGTFAATISGSHTARLTHTRKDGEPKNTFSLKSNRTVTWTDPFLRTHTVQWDIDIKDDNQAVTLVVNGRTHGPFTLDELAEEFETRLSTYQAVASW